MIAQRSLVTFRLLVHGVLLASLVTLSMLAVVAQNAWAGSAPFEALKADHLLLRNRDPQMHSVEQWRALGRRMIRASGRPITQSERGQLIYLGAALFADLAEKRRSIERRAAALDAAVALRALREVAGIGGGYADDALVRAARLYDAYDNGGARDLVARELNRRFPDSEYVAVVAAMRNDADVSKPVTQRPTVRAGQAVDVVLDPGHGGEDLGAQGKAGLLEKDLTLLVALVARRQLEAKGYSVALTRERDQFLPLSSRTKFANDHKAKVFVSIHANAALRPGNRGTESYILDSNQSANVQKLVERENRGAPDEIAFMLGDLIQREKRPEAQRLAQSLQQHVILGLKQAQFITADLGVKRAPFFVLVGTHMPSALIEMGYVDHPEEGLMMSTERYRQTVGVAIAQGIVQFLTSSK